MGVATREKPRKAAVFGWGIYDLANTIFVVSINALHFPLWITEDLEASDSSLAITFSLVTALAMVTSPLLGAVSDRVGRRMPFLIATTVLAVVPTAFLGVRSLPLSLMLFFVANYFYQSGVVFYDALLPEVSTKETRGWVGGLGISLGFIGTFFAIGAGILATWLVPKESARPLTFIVVAVLFLVFALPCFLLVRERANVRMTSNNPVREAFGQLRGTLRLTRTFRPVGRLLLARFFYTNAINTMVLFINIYLTRDLGFSQRQAEMLLLVGVLAPVVGGLTGGKLVDRWNPKRVLTLSLAIWVGALSLTASLAFLESMRRMVWVASTLTGFALGGTFASDRPLMLKLSPPEHTGEFFGLHNMAGRFSAIAGPLLWALVSETLGLGRPFAIAGLAVMALIALLIARGLPEGSDPLR